MDKRSNSRDYRSMTIGVHKMALPARPSKGNGLSLRQFLRLRPLLDRLASNFHVTTVDWRGFGDLPRPRTDWSPDALSAFLNWFLNEVSPGPHALVAAGHAATYALYHAVYCPGVDRLVLIAPTWRGPFPTMMGYRPWFARAQRQLICR